MSIENVKFQMESNYVGMGIGKVAQIVKFSDLTDDGAADGTLNMNKQIPAGSFVIGSKVTVSEAFDGTSTVLSIGTSGDTDEYSGNGTHDLSSVARNLVKSASIGSDVGFLAEAADIDVLLTVSENDDFGDVTTGEMLVEVYYLSTNVELTDWQPTEVNLSA